MVPRGHVWLLSELVLIKTTKFRNGTEAEFHPLMFLGKGILFLFSPLSRPLSRVFMLMRQGQVCMAKKKIETVCGFSCSDCDHHKKDCPGCEETTGKPFWTAFVNIDQCPIYECCMTIKTLPHCGKCPELVCERFTRFKNPEMTDEQAAAGLAAAEKELRARR